MSPAVSARGAGVETSAAETIVVELIEGTSARRKLVLQPGAPTPLVLVGSAAPWRVEAQGLAPTHLALAFNGTTLFVGAPGQTALALDGVDIREKGWVAVPGSAVITAAGARFLVRRRPFVTRPKTPSRTISLPRVASRPVPSDEAETVVPPSERTVVSPPENETVALPLPAERGPSSETTRIAEITAPSEGLGPTRLAPPLRYPHRASPRPLSPPHSPPLPLPLSPPPPPPLPPPLPLSPPPPRAAPPETISTSPGVDVTHASSTEERTALASDLGGSTRGSSLDLRAAWRTASPARKAIFVLLVPMLIAALASARGPAAQHALSDKAMPAASVTAPRVDAGAPGPPAAATAPIPTIDAGAPATLVGTPSQPPAAAAPPSTVRAASTAAPTKGRTAERRALDAAAAGDHASASAQYAELAREHPENPAFAEAARLLAARSSK